MCSRRTRVRALTDGSVPGNAQRPRPAAVAGLGAVLAAVTLLFLSLVTAYQAYRERPGCSAILLPWVVWSNIAGAAASGRSLDWTGIPPCRAGAVRIVRRPAASRD